MQLFQPTSAIHRHAQDNGTSCGRACAQMVISSLTQTPPNTSPIAVGQGILQSREDDKVDITTTPSWFTHPDELVKLLRTATEFTPAHNPADWRIANHASLKPLLADVALAMQRGMPSILNVNESDHWVVLSGIGVDNGKLQYLKVLDPLPLSSGPAHTYVDACSGNADGSTYGQPWTVPVDQLGNLHMKIGNTPPPAGMKNFAGRFVAIVHGSVTRAQLATATRGLIPPLQQRVFGAPVLDSHELFGELRACATRWEIYELRPLLAQNLEPVARLVRNIHSENKSEYSLLSIYSVELKYGAMAVFTPSPVTLMHFRLINDAQAHTSLATVPPTERLWWHREWLPSLNSPYFPFRQNLITNDLAEYQRLYDGYSFNRPPPPQ